jgi:hypothetical protein
MTKRKRANGQTMISASKLNVHCIYFWISNNTHNTCMTSMNASSFGYQVKRAIAQMNGWVIYASARQNTLKEKYHQREKKIR